jgi:hypothetical protein
VLSFIAITKIINSNSSKNEQKKVYFKGELIEIYRKTEDRDTYTYKIKSQQGIIEQSILPYKKSYNYVEIGDSIIKEKGKLEIIIKKKKSNYSTSASFPYE